MKLKTAHLLAPVLLGVGASTFAAANLTTAAGTSSSGDIGLLANLGFAPQLAPGLTDTNFGFASGATLERGSYVTPFSGNYAVSFERDAGANQYTVFNTRVAHSIGVTTTSFAASIDPRLSPLTRLESSWTWSVPDSRAQVRLGDAISEPGTWGQALRFGGIQIGTQTGTRADVITAPLLGAGGVAALPSTADLLGQDLRDASMRRSGSIGVLPQAAQPGSINLPVSDALGRTYVVSRPLFQDISLMPRGKSDFSLEAGLVRQDFARRSDDYGSLLVSGTYRYGVGSKATVDAHAASLGNDVSVVGVGLAEKVGSDSLVSATMATSHTPENSGWLARVGYETNVKGVKLAVRSHVQSARFQNLSTTAGAVMLRERTLASAGMSLNQFGNVSIAGISQAYQDGEHEGVMALSHSVPLGVSGVLSTAATFTPGPSRGSAVLMSVSYPFTTAKHKTKTSSMRNAINNLNDRNLLALLDTTRLK